MQDSSLNEERPGPLRGLRVIDWSQGFGGSLCARLLGDLGADVIKIEPPEGDWMRQAQIFPALNYNKRSVIADPAVSADAEFLRRLLASADAVVENQPLGALEAAGFGFDDLQKLRPGIVLASLSPFGRTGPRRCWRGEDLIACHAGGLAWLVPDWVDDPEKPPLRPAPRQGEVELALNGAVGLLGVLLGRQLGAPGSTEAIHIDVSAQESVAAALHTSLPEYIALGHPRDRFSPTTIFAGFTPVKDGFVRIVCITEAHWQKLGELIGAPELVAAADPRQRLARREAIEQRTAEWAAAYTREKLYRLAQGLRLPFAPVNRPSDLPQQAQIVARGAFVQVPVAERAADFGEPEQRLTLPGAPFRMPASPWRVYRAAPLPGQHTEELRTEHAADTSAPRLSHRRTPSQSAAPGTPYLPLSGVRVADFSWAWAGPHCAIQLADLGAEVIKVESRSRLDNARFGGPYRPEDPIDPNKSLRFTIFNRNKLGVTLNLREPEGLALARSLVAVSDVAVENFAPGVMERLGLGYEALRSVRPDLVMISLSGFGQSGPERDYVAYGYTLEAYAGLAEQSGYRGGGPEALGLPFADPVGGLCGAVAVLAALRHRALTGEGQHIDLSEVESLLTAMTEGFALQAITVQQPERMGNADRFWSPHGVYPCAEGRWIAIAVTTDAEWLLLVRELGTPEWASADALSSRAGRLAARDMLDAAIAAWTRPQDGSELAERLQAAGVPAVPSLHAGHLLHDPHLASRGFFQPVDHPGMGVRPVYSAPFRLGDRPLPIRRAAPLLGQHNQQILGDLLGTPADLLEQFEESGVLR